MMRVTSVEVHNYIFNTTEDNNNVEHYIFPNSKEGGISNENVRDGVEKDLDFSDFTATDFQDGIIGSIFFEDYRKKVSKRMKNDKYVNILAV